MVQLKKITRDMFLTMDKTTKDQMYDLRSYDYNITLKEVSKDAAVVLYTPVSGGGGGG